MRNCININKCILVIIFSLFSGGLYAQKDVFDQSIETAKQLEGFLLDAVASFIKFPDNHENTNSSYLRFKQINSVCKSLQENKYEALSQFDNYKVREFYNSIDKTQTVADAFEELLRPIVGYDSGGIDGAIMDIVIDPLLISSGWNKKKLNIDCEDAYFVEYSYEEFKMMFIKNMLPANDYRNLLYHNIEVTFVYEGMYGGASYYVGGNKYRMVQFKDDKNASYYKIISANSIRRN